MRYTIFILNNGKECLAPKIDGELDHGHALDWAMRNNCMETYAWVRKNGQTELEKEQRLRPNRGSAKVTVAEDRVCKIAYECACVKNTSWAFDTRGIERMLEAVNWAKKHLENALKDVT